MFGYLAADIAPVVEHHLREDGGIERLAVLEGKEDRSDRILAERARSDIGGIVCEDISKGEGLLFESLLANCDILRIGFEADVMAS